MTNPMIPLMGKQADLRTVFPLFQEARRASQENELFPIKKDILQTQRDQVSSDYSSQREQALEESIYQGAKQLKIYLDAGDMNGAMQSLQQRKASLERQGLDTSHTDSAIQGLLNDPERLRQGNERIVQYGDSKRQGKSQFGAQETFKDEKGNLYFGTQRRDPATGQTQSVLSPIGNAPQQPVGNVSITGSYGLTSKEKVGQVGAETTSKKQAEIDVKKKGEQPKARARLESQLKSADGVMSKVDSALENISGLTTGLGGSVLSAVPGTPAYDLKSTVLTVKANLGFDRLQQMREQSPSGGALGNIAVAELEALQSTISSLDLNQSGEQLRENLIAIKRHYENYKNAVESYYQDEYRQGETREFTTKSGIKMTVRNAD